MVTYLVGTDGVSASDTLVEFLREEVHEGDHLEAVNVLVGDSAETAVAGVDALEVFEDAFEDSVTVNTHQYHRGKRPATELLDVAEEIGADKIVIGLRQHSRTERIIFGSVSHSLLQKTDRPVLLVPLPEYTVPRQ